MESTSKDVQQQQNPNGQKKQLWNDSQVLQNSTNICTIMNFYPSLLTRSASAFNIKKAFFIQKSEQQQVQITQQFHFFGNQGTLKAIDFHPFSSLKQAQQYFVENKIFVCGIQICDQSQPINQHPFQGDTVFLMGNEGQGILDVHQEICDHFIYIPQFTDKTASLNVACAATIIFHHFASTQHFNKHQNSNQTQLVWANYQQAPMYGEKFQQIDPQNIQEQKLNLNQDENESDDEVEKSSFDQNEHNNQKKQAKHPQKNLSQHQTTNQEGESLNKFIQTEISNSEKEQIVEQNLDQKIL